MTFEVQQMARQLTLEQVLKKLQEASENESPVSFTVEEVNLIQDILISAKKKRDNADDNANTNPGI